MSVRISVELKEAELALLDDLVRRGLFETREEAVRTAVVNLGVELGLTDRHRERRIREKSTK